MAAGSGNCSRSPRFRKCLAHSRLCQVFHDLLRVEMAAEVHRRQITFKEFPDLVTVLDHAFLHIDTAQALEIVVSTGITVIPSAYASFRHSSIHSSVPSLISPYTSFSGSQTVVSSIMSQVVSFSSTR